MFKGGETGILQAGWPPDILLARWHGCKWWGWTGGGGGGGSGGSVAMVKFCYFLSLFTMSGVSELCCNTVSYFICCQFLVHLISWKDHLQNDPTSSYAACDSNSIGMKGCSIPFLQGFVLGSRKD